jgi:ABC-type multidrug transport system fused ATPase/permease subunit
MSERTNLYAGLICVVSVSVFCSGFVQKILFSSLGEKVTIEIRMLLYKKILSKNIGWFDLRENSTGILSSTMASDTAVINGVGGESVGP